MKSINILAVSYSLALNTTRNAGNPNQTIEDALATKRGKDGKIPETADKLPIRDVLSVSGMSTDSHRFGFDVMPFAKKDSWLDEYETVDVNQVYLDAGKPWFATMHTRILEHFKIKPTRFGITGNCRRIAVIPAFCDARGIVDEETARDYEITADDEAFFIGACVEHPASLTREDFVTIQIGENEIGNLGKTEIPVRNYLVTARDHQRNSWHGTLASYLFRAGVKHGSAQRIGLCLQIDAAAPDCHFVDRLLLPEHDSKGKRIEAYKPGGLALFSPCKSTELTMLRDVLTGARPVFRDVQRFVVCDAQTGEQVDVFDSEASAIAAAAKCGGAMVPVAFSAESELQRRGLPAETKYYLASKLRQDGLTVTFDGQDVVGADLLESYIASKFAKPRAKSEGIGVATRNEYRSKSKVKILVDILTALESGNKDYFIALESQADKLNAAYETEVDVAIVEAK